MSEEYLIRSEEEWIEIFRLLGALYVHGGNREQPHALLTSGNHSNGFFNSGIVTEYPAYLDMAARNLVGLIAKYFQQSIPSAYHPQLVHRVVGPAMGGITLAHDIARCLNFTSANRTRSSYAEKEGDVMIFRRNPVHTNEKVIVCDDVITTGDTTQKVIDAVMAAGGDVQPYIIALVNRSNLTHLGGRKIIALINKPMLSWTPNECPLCAQGSEAIYPKVDGNWERLTATY